MKAASSYVRHMRSHRGEKIFKCEECGNDFVTNGKLSENKRLHTGVFQYNCVSFLTGDSTRKATTGAISTGIRKRSHISVWWTDVENLLELVRVSSSIVD